jgi:hypothetical protein
MRVLIASSLCFSAALGATTACTQATFRQVSFAGESSPAIDSSGRTVHVVRNTQMTDTLLEQRIRAKLETFLLSQGFTITSADRAELYVLATFGSGPRIVGSTAPVFRPAEITPVRTSTGQVVGRSYTPDRIEYLRVPSLENSVWLMLLSSDAAYFRETGRVRNLWRGEAAMRGPPESIGENVPYLIVPALRYFGKGTRQTILLDVRQKETPAM